MAEQDVRRTKKEIEQMRNHEHQHMRQQGKRGKSSVSGFEGDTLVTAFSEDAKRKMLKGSINKQKAGNTLIEARRNQYVDKLLNKKKRNIR